MLRTHQVGEREVWIIQQGWPIDTEMISADRKPEIQKTLKMLSDRQWSQSVNGLAASAQVVRPENHRNPVIIFAIRNTSDHDLWVPAETVSGFICATVSDSNGAHIGYVLSPEPTSSKPVYCKYLQPGQTMYMHPDYCCINLAGRQKLPRGNYSVSVYCKNDQSDGVNFNPDKVGKGHSVTAWTGLLSGGPVELKIEATE